MESYHYQTLMKLRFLEETLSNLLEKVDKEINQTDVEWLHLKNISEQQSVTNPITNNVAPNVTLKKEVQNDTSTKFIEKLENERIDIEKLENERIDDHSINSIMLDLKTIGENHFNRGNEEFDSDSDSN